MEGAGGDKGAKREQKGKVGGGGWVINTQLNMGRRRFFKEVGPGRPGVAMVAMVATSQKVRVAERSGVTPCGQPDLLARIARTTPSHASGRRNGEANCNSSRVCVCP